MAAATRVTGPMVLVLREKHENRYFNVKSNKALFAVALKIVTARFEEGWYPEPSDSKPKAPDFTKDQVASLPESMRPAAEKQLRTYLGALRFYESELAEYRQVKKAVTDHDGEAAWAVLRSRKDAEYEGYDLVRVEDVEED